MLALKWQTGFPNPFGGFSASCRGGGEYLSCSLWQQRISVLLEPSAILLFQSVFLKCVLAGARRWSEIRHNLTDGRRDFQKRLKDTWGKNSSLISATRRRVQAIHLGCLLRWSQSWGDLRHWSSTELEAVTWDLHWCESGPMCPQIGPDLLSFK